MTGRNAVQDLEKTQGRLLKRSFVRDRPGRRVLRYWHEGPGFDRNLFTVKAVQASIDYIHNNPVQRGLCQKTGDWGWSSARFYESDASHVDPLLPRITPLTADSGPDRENNVCRLGLILSEYSLRLLGDGGRCPLATVGGRLVHSFHS